MIRIILAATLLLLSVTDASARHVSYGRTGGHHSHHQRAVHQIKLSRKH